MIVLTHADLLAARQEVNVAGMTAGLPRTADFAVAVG